jgi:hypothetical protein
VHYPGLPSHPRHSMVQELFSGKGCGGMLGFEVQDGPAADAVLQVGGRRFQNVPGRHASCRDNTSHVSRKSWTAGLLWAGFTQHATGIQPAYNAPAHKLCMRVQPKQCCRGVLQGQCCLSLLRVSTTSDPTALYVCIHIMPPPTHTHLPPTPPLCACSTWSCPWWPPHWVVLRRW